jgi:asparagine synthase (glutamine-hydrolysing)
MCGIAGIINLNREPVAQRQIKAMTDKIAHRGPDGEGYYGDEFVGLGHRRLSIIDLSDYASQPMSTKDGRYSIIYNGEMYNFQELRQKLQKLDYHFFSNSDTEVVLNAFAEWGEKCLDHFNGMFAIAIWDKIEKKLFLARDRYGIKPIYYYFNGKNFVFCSEIKGIIASGLYKPNLDKEGLVEYLTFQNFFTDRTLFKDIRMMPAGHFAYISPDAGFKPQQYWDFDFNSSSTITEAEAIEETDRLFMRAIERQLVSDVPVNAYLSGGIDSGAITMLASKIIPHMRTFTVGFDLSSASGLELSFDERAMAERISSLAKTEQYEMVLKAGDMERCMDSYVWHLEEPRVGQSYPNYYAAKLASKFGKVVLSGAGGDELFAGYPWRYFYSNQPISFDNFVDSYYLKWQRLFPNTVLKELLSPIWGDIKDVWTRDIFANVFKSIKKDVLQPEDCVNFSLYLEAKTFLHGLLVVEDKLSMAHSLETRVPFLDNDLVDFAMKLPSFMKIANQSAKANENDLGSKIVATKDGKIVLRKTLARHLHDDIAQNKKQGFSSPDASWFRGESIDYVQDELADCLPFFNQEVIDNILKKHTSGAENHRLAIWSLLYIHTLFKSELMPSA